MKKEYEEILGLPRHVSTKHPPMPIADRAAQFLPFAALTGYDDAIRESARLTEERPELDEHEREALDARMQAIAERIDEEPEISILYFKEDAQKSGGSREKIKGRIKKIDEYSRAIVMCDGMCIDIDDIIDIGGEMISE